MSERDKPHSFVLYVENRPGVLNRIASLFRRRAVNIESLTVGHTERAGVSRMTIVSTISDGAAHRVEANIYKLVNVISVEDVTFSSRVSRGLALIKMEAREETRHRLMEIVRIFRARVIDLAPQTLIMEITGPDDKIDALVEVLRPFGILEMVRTGQVVMTRGVKQPSDTEASQALPEERRSAVESSHSV